jgi:hypothetical protein
MAATGATPIILYHSTTPSQVPVNTNLAAGELALNIADMKLYCENSSGVVTLLASASGAAGDVVGPSSAVANNMVIFDSTSGKLIKDSNVTVTPPATSATLTLADGSSLITSGGHSLTFTTTAATSVTLPTSGSIANTGKAIAMALVFG